MANGPSIGKVYDAEAGEKCCETVTHDSIRGSLTNQTQRSDRKQSGMLSSYI